MTAAHTSGHWAERDHLFPVRVYYEDTDFSGFVYHANYVKFFERGRSEALRLTGVTHGDLLNYPPAAGLVVRRMEIDFIRPAVIDDALIVRSVMETAKGARMTIRQTIERAGEPIVKAWLEIALINLDGRPRKIPPELAAKLAPWLQGAP